MTKVNIDTDLRLAATGAIRKYLAQNPAEFDPRKYNIAAMKAMQSVCIQRFDAFGASGHADKITPISLERMVEHYQS